ncbi:MAG: ribosome maturation factor RimP [Candidatus Poribacteria bacterium]|nr:ribosome maturation factor RimP [Candidatus Poribacteria bacterium]
MTSVLKSSMIELLSPVLGQEGIELVDVEFQGENRVTTVRLLIYQPDGITVKDCQQVSRMVQPILEVHGLIDSEVALEVASPGIDRPLATEADFRRNIGRAVQIETASATGESLQLSGTVMDVKDGLVCLDGSGKVTELQISTIIRAQIQLMW